MRVKLNDDRTVPRRDVAGSCGALARRGRDVRCIRAEVQWPSGCFSA